MEEVNITNISDEELDVLLSKAVTPQGRAGARNLKAYREEKKRREMMDKVCSEKAQELGFKYDKRKRNSFVYRPKHIVHKGGKRFYASATCYPNENGIKKGSPAAAVLSKGFKLLGRSVEAKANEYKEGICPTNFKKDGFTAQESFWRTHHKGKNQPDKRAKQCLAATAVIRKENPDMVSKINKIAWKVNEGQLPLKQANRMLADMITPDALKLSTAGKRAISRKINSAGRSRRG